MYIYHTYMYIYHDNNVSMMRIFFAQFYTRYIGQNNNSRYLNLTGTMIFAYRRYERCYVFLVAIDLSQFLSITFGSKLQSHVSSLCSAFVVRGVRRWSLKETVRDITRLVKGAHSASDENAKAAFGWKVAPLPSSYTNPRPFFREYVSEYWPAPLVQHRPGIVTPSPAPPFSFARGLLPRNCANTRKLAMWWGWESCGCTRVYLGSSSMATGIIPDSRANPCDGPDTD